MNFQTLNSKILSEVIVNEDKHLLKTTGYQGINIALSLGDVSLMLNQMGLGAGQQLKKEIAEK